MGASGLNSREMQVVFHKRSLSFFNELNVTGPLDETFESPYNCVFASFKRLTAMVVLRN